jgi:hypothetical protein
MRSGPQPNHLRRKVHQPVVMIDGSMVKSDAYRHERFLILPLAAVGRAAPIRFRPIIARPACAVRQREVIEPIETFDWIAASRWSYAGAWPSTWNSMARI